MKILAEWLSLTAEEHEIANRALATVNAWQYDVEAAPLSAEQRNSLFRPLPKRVQIYVGLALFVEENRTLLMVACVIAVCWSAYAVYRAAVT